VDVKVNGSHSAPFYICGFVDPNQGSIIDCRQLPVSQKPKTAIRMGTRMR